MVIKVDGLALSAGFTTVVAIWDGSDINDVAYYSAEISKEPDFQGRYNTVINVKGHLVSFSNLDPDTKYFVRVRTVPKDDRLGDCRVASIRTYPRNATYELLDGLKRYAIHLSTCKSNMFLLTNPPKNQPCDCGLSVLLDRVDKLRGGS